MATTKVSGNLIKTATVTGNNIATNTITTNNISTSVNLGGPKITTITYPGDDTAADTAGGQTVVLTGNGFVTGASVLLDGVAVGSATVTNTTSISFTTPAKSTGSYIVYVVNTDGSTAILVPGIQYSGVPSFTTAAGSLGSAYEYAAVSSTIAATSDSSVSYSLYSGSLPDGVTLASNGQLSGTTTAQSGNTTFSFTVRATDAQNQDTDRNFSVTINIDAVTWSAPANNATITTYEYTAISNTFVSTSAAGRNVTYSANVLPANVSITGSTVSGTPTTVGNTTSLITATSNTTNRTAVQTLNFVVQQDSVTWSSPANNVTYTWAQNVANTANLAATSAAGKAITFTANSLPTGLAVSGNTITGTPTVAGNSSSLITATAATTNRTAVQTINWVIQLAADAYWKNTTFLISSNTTSNTFTQDASLNNTQLSIYGDARPSNFNPYSDGYYSMYFDGNGDYVTGTQPSALGTGDFTFEFWMNPATAAGTTGIFDTSTGADYTNCFGMGMGSSQQLRYLIGGGTGDFANTSIPAGVWTHVAFVRTSGTGYLYINGTLATSLSVAGDFTNTGFCLGRWAYWGATYQYTGYLSNFRLVKSAVYTSNFTPSTAPLAVIANTSVLTCVSNRFIDKSTNAITLTRSGGAAIRSANPLVANSSYASYGSSYFDGTGDYITASNGGLAFGTGDFTIEMWVYLNSSASAYTSFFSTNPASTYNGVIMGTDVIGIYSSGGGGGASMSPTIPVDTWTHVAMARQGTTVRVFLNGALAGSFSSSMDVNNSSAAIGARYVEGSYPWFGYISDVRVTKGTALYTTTFTPPTTPLTSNSNTALLTCQYNGGATNSGFIDQSNYSNLITRSGNVTQGTFSPYNSSGWSLYFPGSTADYVTSPSSTDYSFGAGDYTIEAWVYSNSLGYGSAGNIWYFALPEVNAILRHNGSVWQCYYGAGGASFTNVSTDTVGINQWVHHAVVRSGSTVKWYINGVQQGSGTDATSYSGAGTVRLGEYAGYGYHGYISNFRFVKGTAVYTSAFTPPTAPLPPTDKTKALFAQSNRIVDNSSGSQALTVTGTVKVQPFSPFGASTVVPTSYSNYFDGTGDYLTLPPSANFTFGTGDFTIEGWTYIVAAGDKGIFQQGTSSFPASTAGSVALGITNSGYWQIYANNTNTNSAAAYSLNTWYHFAIVRSSSSTKLYINGTAVITVSDSTNYTGTYFGIGSIYGTSGTNINAFISNLRVVKGTALYTGAFTSPTSPLTTTSQGATASQVSLLTCQSSTMIDNSTNYATITAVGDTKVSQFNPFGITTTTNPYSPSVNGGSMYFDGTGDYLTISTGDITNLSSSANWTVEAWIYPTVLTGGVYEQVIYGSGFSFGGYGTLLIVTNNNSQIVSGGTLQTNQWQHIAVVNIAGSSLKLYLNGVQVGSTTATSFAASTTYVGMNSGGSQSFTGYISDLRVTNGGALYTSNFYPGAAPVTSSTIIGARGYTSSLYLPGTSNGITDVHGTTNLETFGDTKLAYESPYESGYYSNYFNNLSAEASLVTSNTNVSLGAGDFTIECWLNNDYGSSVDGRAALKIGDATPAITLYGWGTSNTNIAGYNSSGTNVFSAGGPATITRGTWSHHAIVRSSGVIKYYLDGVSVYSISNSTNFTQTGASIGYWNATGGWIGYISNVRVVVGTAVYTSTFTPPTTALTAIPGTQLLACQSNKFADSSTNALTFTKTGTVSVKSTNPFRKNTGTSVYFDGTGDYLYHPATAPAALGSGNFTIECWYYQSGGTGYRAIYSNRNLPDETTSTSTVFLGLTGDRLYYDSYNTQLTGSGSVSTGAWNHIACVRSGTTVTLYLNGVSQGTITDGVDKTIRNVFIGGQGSVYFLNGYISDLRVTKGVARYTTSFTPPTEPLIAK